MRSGVVIVLHKVTLNGMVFSGMIYTFPRRMEDVVRPPARKFVDVGEPPVLVTVREVVGVTGVNFAVCARRDVAVNPIIGRIVLVERNVHRLAAVVDENAGPGTVFRET